ncbi:PGF-CTERM sorting domain-containing protein [Natronorubrum aibiense]|nr:PGF-CTERM sorting domain-containing protein [Natronorubrum aibiense]
MAGLLVLSVVAMSAAFAGGAAANHAEEDVTFNDQAVGENEEGEPIFAVQSVDAHAGQYLVIENENSGEVLYEATLDEDLNSAAIFQTVEQPGEYTVTVYEDKNSDDVKATDSASVYAADIAIDDQTSTDETIDQVSVGALVVDGVDADTEYDVVLTDEDGDELGSATGLTGVNEDISIDTSAIETETVVTATIYVDGEPLEAYYDEAGAFESISDSATVTPGVDDGDNEDEDKDGDDKDGDDKDGDDKDGDDKDGDDKDGDDKDGDNEKDYTKKGDKDYTKKSDKDYTKKGDKDYDDKNGVEDDKNGDEDDKNGDEDDKNGDEDDKNGDEDDKNGDEDDKNGDEDTDSETDQDQDNDQDSEQDSETDQDQDNDQENKSEQDSLPGFGIGIGLVALLAAAMLALRRQN